MRQKMLAIFFALSTLFTQECFSQGYYSNEYFPQEYNTNDCCPATCCNDDIIFEVSSTLGRWVGVNKSYGSIGAMWSPLDVNCLGLGIGRSSKVFMDLRGHYGTFWHRHRVGINVGAGYRVLTCDDRVIGANIYYDYTKGVRKNFHQIGVGAEWLGETWDFRINGYFPVDGHRRLAHRNLFNDYVGGYFVIENEYEFALRGFNAELGITFLRWGCFDLYAAGGPYYYQQRDFDSFWGGYGRFRATYANIAYVEARVCGDDVFDTRFQFKLGIDIPFEAFCNCNYPCNTCNSSCSCWNPCELFLEEVERNDWIAQGSQCCFRSNF